MITDSGMLKLIFLTSFIFGCLNLAILLILLRCFLNKKIEESEKRAEERAQNMLMRFMIIIGIIALMGIACAEEVPILDDPDFAEGEPFDGVAVDTGIDPGPVVFPEVLPKASHEISINYYGLMGEINITTFDQEWLDFLNQTNLTA